MILICLYQLCLLILRIIWLKIFYFYITLFDNIDVCWDTVCHRAYPVCKAEISQKILFSLYLYDLHRTVSEFMLYRNSMLYQNSMLFCVCSFTPLCFEWVSKTKTSQVWRWIKRGWRSLIEEIKVKFMCMCRSEQMILSKQRIVIWYL